MGYEIADCILIPLILVGLFFAVRGTFRLLRDCYREVRDAYYIVKRGVLNPIQVREEFILTTGREPTVQEVHDLHEMIKSEHDKARNGLLAVGAGIVGVLFLFHRSLHGKG